MSTVHKNHGKKLLSILNEQITSLLSYEDYTPQIEIDIVKDNMRKLYECIDSINSSVAVTNNISHKNVEDIDKEINDLLDNAQAQFQKEDEQIEQQIKEQEVALEEQSIEDSIEPEIPNEEEIIKVHEEIDTAIITNELTEEISNEIIEETAPVVEAKVEEAPVEKAKDKVETTPFAEASEVEKEEIVKTTPFAKASEVKKTVHVLDVMPEEEPVEEDNNVKKDVLLAKSLKLKAIKSLKTGIGINDKFMIINDLFEGRAKEFNAAANKLDSQEDMQQALYLLDDMKDENLWESDDRVFKIFKKYIQRRYI